MCSNAETVSGQNDPTSNSCRSNCSIGIRPSICPPDHALGSCGVRADAATISHLAQQRCSTEHFADVRSCAFVPREGGLRRPAWTRRTCMVKPCIRKVCIFAAVSVSFSPSGHNHYAHGRSWAGFSHHGPCGVVVGEPQAKLSVEFQFLRRVGFANHFHQPAERINEVCDLLLRHPLVWMTLSDRPGRRRAAAGVSRCAARNSRCLPGGPAPRHPRVHQRTTGRSNVMKMEGNTVFIPGARAESA